MTDTRNCQTGTWLYSPSFSPTAQAVASSHEQALRETVDRGDPVLSAGHEHRDRFPVARTQEAKLEAIVDFREAQV